MCFVPGRGRKLVNLSGLENTLLTLLDITSWRVSVLIVI